MAIQASSSCGGYSLSVQGWVAMVAARAPPGAAPMPSSRPPAADVAVKIKPRRLMAGARRDPPIPTSSRLRHARGAVDSAAQCRIGPAAVDVGDVRVDVSVSGLGESLQEG